MGPISRLFKGIFGKKQTETKKENKPEVKQEQKPVVPAKVSVTPELAKKVSDPYGFGVAADEILESSVDVATVFVASTISDDSYSQSSICDSSSYSSGSSSSDSGSSYSSCD